MRYDVGTVTTHGTVKIMHSSGEGGGGGVNAVGRLLIIGPGTMLNRLLG